MKDLISCKRCGYVWEEGRNIDNFCPLCRNSLNKKVAPNNVQGDAPIAHVGPVKVKK